MYNKEPSMVNIINNLIQKEKENRNLMIRYQKLLDTYQPHTAEYLECAKKIEYYQGYIAGVRVAMIQCQCLFAIQGGSNNDIIR